MSEIKPATSPARRFRLSFLQGLLLGLSLGVVIPPAAAEPRGGRVSAGQGSIDQSSENLTRIEQRSQRLILDWQSFDVRRGETVRFEQPNARAQALNRIFDHKPSEISGRIEANGQVLLMNPNGVFFQAGSQVNVGGLIASGLNIDADAFMLGKLEFEGIDLSDGLVVNHGLLEAASGGAISLIGKAVDNQGLILASAGQVNLVAGERVTVDFDGDGLLQFSVDESVVDNARSLTAAISNSGEIDASSVLMTASAARDVFTHSINNSGVVRAARIDRQGGEIRLVGTGPGSSVINTGSLDASARADGSGGTIGVHADSIDHSGVMRVDAGSGNAGSIRLQADDTILVQQQALISAKSASGGTGGDIAISAERVGLLDEARVDASGERGGGRIRIGGGRHGRDADLANASRTVVDRDVSINADALALGDGGEVILWSDLLTVFQGSVSARGGQSGGDGGFMELSSAVSLSHQGVIDLSAPAGNTGTLLLDPLNIEIQGGSGDGSDDTDATATQLVHDSGSNTAGSILFADEGSGTPDPFIITEEEIETQGATANIILEARNSITVSGTFDNDADGAGGDDPGTGTVLIQNGNSLTLRTRNDGGDGIGGINLGSIAFATAGGGDITLQTGNDGLGGGGSEAGSAAITVGALSASGNLNISAEGVLTINDAISGSDVDLSTVDGVINVLGDVTATSGNLAIDANGNSGDLTVAATLSTGTGDITLTADNDVNLAAAALIDTDSGNVSVTADADDGGAASGALLMTDGALIDAGTGTITLLADEDITVAGLLTGNATAAAVSITSREGGLIDAGDTHTDIIANAAGAVTDLNTVTGVGNGGAIETTIAAVDINNTTSGSIELAETDGLIASSILQGVDADANDITLTTTTGDLGVNLISTGGTDGDVVLVALTGAITESSSDGGADVVADTLSITSANGIGAADALETAVSEFVLDNTAAGDIDIDNTTATNSSIAAMATIGGAIDFDQAGGGDLSIDGSVTSGDALGTDGGNISVRSTAGLTVNAVVDSSAGSGGTLTLTGVTIGAGLAPEVGAGDITLESATTLDTVIEEDIALTQTSIVLNALRDIIIEADISSTGAFDISLNADTDADAAGGIWIKDSGSVASGQDLTLTGAGLVDAGAAGETVRVDADGANLQLQAGDELTLQHNGAAGLTNQAMQISGHIDALNTLSVNAWGDLLVAATADISSTGGPMSLNADEATGDNGFVFTQSDGSQIDSGSGTLSIIADGDVSLASINSDNAGTTAITVTSSSGAIVDAGDTDTDITTDGRIVMQAENAIGGSANPLDIEVDSIDANSTSAGINLRESDDATVFSALATAAGGDIDIRSAGGDLTLATVTADDQLTLEATAGALLDDGSGATVLAADQLSLLAASGIGTLTDFDSAAGDALEVDIDTTITRIEITDAGADIHLDIGTSTAAFDAGSVIVDADGIADVLIRSSSSFSVDPAALSVSADDRIGFVSGDVLTLPNAGLNFADNELLLRGDTDIIRADSGRNLSLIAERLIVDTGSGGGATTLTTSVDSLQVDSAANDLVINETDALTIELVVGTGAVTINSGGAISSNSDDNINDITGVDVSLNATTGGIGSSGTSLDVAASNSLSADTSADSSDIFIDAIGTVQIDDINAGGGDVQLHGSAALRGLNNDNVADIRGATIELLAAAGGIGAVATLLEVQATASVSADTSADNAAIYLESLNNLVVDSFDAGTGTVIIEGQAAINGLANDGTADIIAGTLDLTAAAGGIGGSGSELEISASTQLDTDTTADNGNQFIDAIGSLNVGLMQAGSGSIALSGTQALIDGNAGTDNLRAASITLQADTGIGDGDALEVNAGTVTAVTVDTSGGVELIDTSGSGLQIQSMDIAGDVVLTADEIDFTGGAASIAGNAGLTLIPQAIGTSIDIGSPTGGTGTLDISDTDLAALADGFSAIAIGYSGTGAHDIVVGSMDGPATLKDPLTIHSPAASGVSPNLIDIRGNIATSGDGAVAFDGPTTFGGVINLSVTGAGGLVFSDDVIIGDSNVTLTALAGDVLFQGFVDSEAPAGANEHNPLTVVASGNVRFQDKVGSAQNGSNANTGSLGQLRIDATDVRFDDTVDVGGLEIIATGVTRLAGDITTTGMTNAGGIPLTGVDLSQAAGGITLLNSLTVDTSVNNLDIDWSGSDLTAGGNNLILIAGSGADVTTAGLTGVGTLDLRQASQFRFDGAVTATTLTTAVQPYALSFNGGGSITNAVSFANTGALTLGNDAADSLTFVNGVDTSAGPASVNLAGTIASTDADISLGDAAGSVTLGDDTSIDAGTGTVTIGSVNGGGNSFTVDATTLNSAGDISADAGIALNANVIIANGDTRRLTSDGGDLSIQSIDGTDNTDGLIERLRLDAGSGDVSVGAIGSVGAETLESVAVLAADEVTFTGAIHLQDNLGLSGITTGATISNSLNAADLVTAAGAYSFTLLADTTLTGSAMLNNAGGVTLGDALADMLLFTGGLSSDAGVSTLNATIQSINQDLQFADVVLAGDTSLDTGNGDINMDSVAGAGQQLTVDVDAAGRFQVQNDQIVVDTLSTSGTGSVSLAGGGQVDNAAFAHTGGLNLNGSANDLVFANGLDLTAGPTTVVLRGTLDAGNNLLNLGNASVAADTTLVASQIRTTGLQGSPPGNARLQLHQSSGNITIAGGGGFLRAADLNALTGNYDRVTIGNGSGTLTIAGNQTFSHSTVLDAGTITVDADRTLTGAGGGSLLAFNAPINAAGHDLVLNNPGGSAIGIAGDISSDDLEFNSSRLILNDDVLIRSATDKVSFNTSVLGNFSLNIAPSDANTHYFIGGGNGVGQLRSTAFGGFNGHLIIGAELNPTTLPASDAVVVGAVAESISIDAPFQTGGALTLIANGLTLNDSFSAGGPGGGALTMLAANGDITAGANIDIAAGSGLIVASGTFNNSEQVDLLFNGGELILALGESAEDQSFGAASSVSGVENPDLNSLALLQSLGLVNLQAIEIVITNPAAQLTGLDAVQFIDTGLFESDLSLFSVIGSGLAMELSQCEELEGCAPDVTEEELEHLIDQIDIELARIEAAASRGDINSAEASRLIQGYRQEQQIFSDYLQRLRDYNETREQLALEELEALEALENLEAESLDEGLTGSVPDAELPESQQELAIDEPDVMTEPESGSLASDDESPPDGAETADQAPTESPIETFDIDDLDFEVDTLTDEELQAIEQEEGLGDFNTEPDGGLFDEGELPEVYDEDDFEADDLDADIPGTPQLPEVRDDADIPDFIE